MYTISDHSPVWAVRLVLVGSAPFGISSLPTRSDPDPGSGWPSAEKRSAGRKEYLLFLKSLASRSQNGF